MVEEIQRVLGDEPITFQSVQRLEYVEAVISETLRLYPSVPIDAKVAVGPDILPGGHPIKKGVRGGGGRGDRTRSRESTRPACSPPPHPASPPPPTTTTLPPRPPPTPRAQDWVLYAPYVMGRDPSLWENPRSFLPERWLEMRSKPSPFKWPSFNAGPRTCLGMRMAFLEAKTVLAMLYREFRPRMIPGHKVHYLVTVTLPMRYGLRVVPHQQKG